MQPSLAAAVASAFGADHDVIVFDQQVLQDAAQGAGNAEADAHYVAVALACRDRLIGQGAHLAVYSTAESAADVNDIRLAPGLPPAKPGRRLLRDLPGPGRHARVP